MERTRATSAASATSVAYKILRKPNGEFWVVKFHEKTILNRIGPLSFDIAARVWSELNGKNNRRDQA